MTSNAQPAPESTAPRRRSLRGAINAYCRGCVDPTGRNQGEGTWREQVNTCGVETCPFYALRPRPAPKMGPSGGYTGDETLRPSPSPNRPGKRAAIDAVCRDCIYEASGAIDEDKLAV